MIARLARAAFGAGLALLTPFGALAQTGSDADARAGVAVEQLQPLDLSPEAQAESLPGDVVTLRALDKLTGEVRMLEGKVGEPISFERLRIEIDACFVRVGGRAPESSVFLRVFDSKIEEEQGASFSGWMFASTPALSAMDHPRYDVWVLSCAIS